MTKIKEIKIFLGSSIYDFKNERKDLSDFIQKRSEYFERAYNTKLVVLMCEDVDPAMTKERKQEKLNNLVRQSDICFFMFDKKVGIFTEEEFDLAYNTFKATNKPIIYPYFKVIGENEAEQSLLDFKAKLIKTYGQYPIDLEHIDTIKLRLLQTLNETAFDGVLDIKPDGNKILVDGNEMFSTENIAEFANNVLFKKLTDELQQADARYAELDSKFRNRSCTAEEEIEYLKIAQNRINLNNQIDELRKNIFKMSLRMCRDEIRGEITQLQREAYRLFEAGDLEEANKILNDKDITKAYQQDKADRKEEQKIKTRAYIGELRTKIEILTVMPNITKFEEIEKLYDTIVAEAFEQKVEIDVIRDFAWFLYYQNKLEKAYTIAKRLENLIADDDNEQETARVYHLLATVSAKFSSKKDETQKYYDKVIDIRERLSQSNPDRFNPNLATSYNNAGNFYYTQGQPKKAEDFYIKAIAIRERLAKYNPDRFEPDLAQSYNNAGNFYKDQGQHQKAEDFYIKAIAIRERLAKYNPDRFEPDLATSYNNAGNFYQTQGQPKKAEDFYNKAIAIRERLAKSNPDRFEHALAQSYNNAGEFYRIHGQPQKAEDFYIKAIAIRERLAKSNPDRFEPDLATSYNNAGNFYETQGQPKKAEDFYIKAIAIFEKLAKTNPDRFEPDLAMSYNNAGIFYVNHAQPQKAEEFYNKAIGIRERLAKSNPDRFEPDLAMSYNNAGVFYQTQGQPQKAEDFYNKAIALFEKLAKSNPDRFEPDLAMSYNNAGLFYNDQGQPQKAEEFYNKAIAIRERLAKSNPDRFEPVLANSYYNYAILKNDNALFKKAFNLAKKHPHNPYCRQIIERLKNKF